MKKLLVLVLLVAAGCNARLPESGDAEFILDYALAIRTAEYYYTDKDGTRHYDSLREYQHWQLLYDKYKTAIGQSQNRTERDFRYWLFLGHISWSVSDAAGMEAFSRDLMPVYNRDSTVFLETLRELPFLVSSVCYYLNNHFGFEGDNQDGKLRFVESNR